MILVLLLPRVVVTICTRALVLWIRDQVYFERAHWTSVRRTRCGDTAGRSAPGSASCVQEMNDSFLHPGQPGDWSDPQIVSDFCWMRRGQLGCYVAKLSMPEFLSTRTTESGPEPAMPRRVENKK